MHRYGIVDFVGGISWEKYYQYIDQLHTIQQQCGANRILSVNFSVRNVRTIQQQCRANCILQ